MGTKSPVATDKTRTGTSPGTGGTKPSDRAAGQKNNVYTDKKGDVYRNDNGNWQKNNGKNWESAQPKTEDRSVTPSGQQERVVQPKAQDRSSGFNRQEMEMQNSARQRGAQNLNNRSTIQRSMSSGAGKGGGRRR
jgi:hypothetical protein